jgi:cytochrome b6-f complex iron-sulfur subunit
MSDAETTAPDPGRAIAVDTPVAKPVPSREVITRRLFLLGGFWSAMGLGILGLVGGPLDFVWPRNIKGFGGPINVTPDRIPAVGGDPLVITEGKFFILNLEAGETPNGESTPGGVLALWRKCPHLGCTIPYNAPFEFQGRKGWFRCPCHNSTYTKEGGVIVFGPAPRSMDVFPIEVQDDGSLIVQTGRQFEGSGSPNNPTRAIPLEPGNVTPEA